MIIYKKSSLPLRWVTQEQVCKRVCYDLDTGIFTNRTNSTRAKAGAIAGYVCGVGYRRICINGRQYLAHRLAWLIVHGEWVDYIDHKNGERDDNRIGNLRSCNASQNIANSKKSDANKSGYKGVYLSRNKQKWCADIRINFRKVYLGSFDTPEAASKAYQTAALCVFGDFARAA